MEDKSIFNTGDTPPEGTYTCMSCGSSEASYSVPEMVKELPVCPVCGSTLWYKV